MTSERRPFAGAVVVAAVAGAFAVAAPACADFSRGEPLPVDAAGADAATSSEAGGSDRAAAPLSFATAVRPLLLAGCSGCHAPGLQAGDTQLLFSGDAAADYQAVSRFVTAGAPASSTLLRKMSGKGHGGGAVYAEGSSEYETVASWILGGALP